jgi:hypothetical protein
MLPHLHHRPGQEEGTEVKLLTRRQNTQEQTSDATHAWSRVYTAKIGPFQAGDGVIEYFATCGNQLGVALRSGTSAEESVHAEHNCVTLAMLFC